MKALFILLLATSFLFTVEAVAQDQDKKQNKNTSALQKLVTSAQGFKLDLKEAERRCFKHSDCTRYFYLVATDSAVVSMGTTVPVLPHLEVKEEENPGRGERYVVKKGDAMERVVAKLFPGEVPSAKVREVCEINRVSPCDDTFWKRIQPGDVFFLPLPKGTPVATAAVTQTESDVTVTDGTNSTTTPEVEVDASSQATAPGTSVQNKRPENKPREAEVLLPQISRTHLLLIIILFILLYTTEKISNRIKIRRLEREYRRARMNSILANTELLKITVRNQNLNGKLPIEGSKIDEREEPLVDVIIWLPPEFKSRRERRPDRTTRSRLHLPKAEKEGWVLLGSKREPVPIQDVVQILIREKEVREFHELELTAQPSIPSTPSTPERKEGSLPLNIRPLRRPSGTQEP